MVQKTILDYYEQLFQLYPDVPKQDIRRILQYGYKSLYMHNSYGGDVLLILNGFWFYCGYLMKDSLKYFNYYVNKMIVKLRVMYKRKKIPFNGYYYFALSLKQYDNYKNLKNKRGRPKKYFEFEHIVLYKIYDECNIHEHSKVAIFKIHTGFDFGFIDYKEQLRTDKAELILERPPLCFKDVLLSNYNYEFISLKHNLKGK